MNHETLCLCETLHNLLINFLSHDIRPEDHTRSKVVINCTGTSGIINNGNHVILLVQRYFSYVRLVSEEQRRMRFGSPAKSHFQLDNESSKVFPEIICPFFIISSS